MGEIAEDLIAAEAAGMSYEEYMMELAATAEELDKRRDYWVVGDSYPYRAKLKSWGCTWDPDRKRWLLRCSMPEDKDYRVITQKFNLTLIPVEDRK